MTVIHMETEVVRAAAQKLDWAAGELYLKPNRLRGNAIKLRDAWVGGRSAAYAAEMRRLANVLQAEVINLQRLATRVRNEVDEWEEGDLILYLKYGGRGMGPGRLELENLDRVLGIIENTLEHFVENQEIADLMKQPWVKGYFSIISFGIDTYSGILDGEAVEKALVSAGLSVGVETLFTMNPIGGGIMIVNSVIQLSGEIVVSNMEMEGYVLEAEAMSDYYDSIDLAGYIDDLSNAVTDIILPPYNDPPDFSAVAERFSKGEYAGGFRGTSDLFDTRAIPYVDYRGTSGLFDTKAPTPPRYFGDIQPDSRDARGVP